MGEMATVSSDLESTSAMIKQLQDAFGLLESHRESNANSVISWKEIEEHFLNLEGSYRKRYEELLEKEKALKERETQTSELLVQRETEVANQEQALLDRLQEIKDASVAAIVEARMKFKVPSPEPTHIEIAENKVISTSNGELLSAIDGKFPDKMGQHPEAVATEVKPRPELILLCEKMDPKGLLKYIFENRKDFSAIREEMPFALKHAPEPARLVLESLDGFFPSNLIDDAHQEGNKGDQGLAGHRRSCVFLMDSLAQILLVESELETPMNADIKQRAKTIAAEWKPKLALEVRMEGASSSSLEAQAFLQLIAIYGISSEFHEDELCKLVLAVSHRRQTTNLCRYIGLTHKMPEIIDDLVKYGRHIEAFHFIQAFHLAEIYPPVPLLKEHLKELRKNSQKNGANSGKFGGLSDANGRELGALKPIIRLIEDYKLESEYDPEPLLRRVAQLDKAKADRKRTGHHHSSKNHPPKRGRVHSEFRHSRPHPSPGRQPPPFPLPPAPQGYGGDRGVGYRVPPSYPYPNPPYDYAAPVPPVHPSQPVYGQQTSAANSYYYQEERPPPTPQSYYHQEERPMATPHSYYYQEERPMPTPHSYYYQEDRPPAPPAPAPAPAPAHYSAPPLSYNAPSSYGAYAGNAGSGGYPPQQPYM